MTLRPLVFVDGAGACECPQESAMMKIVVYLRRIEHREFRVDRAAQTRVRGAKRLFDGLRARPPREDESEIAGTLGQRQQTLIHLRRDLYVDDVRHLSRGIHTVDTAKHSTPRDRDHHYAGGVRFTPPRGCVAECVPEEQFLQRD